MGKPLNKIQYRPIAFPALYLQMGIFNVMATFLKPIPLLYYLMSLGFISITTKSKSITTLQ